MPLRRAPVKWATNWAEINGHDKDAIFNNEISHARSLSLLLTRKRERRQTNRSASLTITMLNEALLFLLDILLQPFAAILLLRFHLQWLRAPMRNPIGEFIMVLTDFLVLLLMAAVFAQAILSWVNPHSPIAPLLAAATRRFMQPLRRIVPVLGSVDLSPLLLFIICQLIVIIPIGALERVAFGLL